MKIRWRLKVRWFRDFSGSFLKSLYHNPKRTIKIVCELPFLWLQHLSEFENDNTPNPMPNPMAEAPYYEQDIELMREVKNLFDNLPPILHDFARYFDSACYSEKEVEEIFSYEELQKFYEFGLPYTRLFLLYGVTPVDFFYAVSSVAGLLARVRRVGAISDAPLHIEVATGHTQEIIAEGEGTIRLDEMLVEEIAHMIDIAPTDQRAEGLWRLMFTILPYRPYLIEGYEARIEGDVLLLAPTLKLKRVSIDDTLEQRNEKLKKCWRTKTLLS